jgi:hypothetical protein
MMAGIRSAGQERRWPDFGSIWLAALANGLLLAPDS